MGADPGVVGGARAGLEPGSPRTADRWMAASLESHGALRNVVRAHGSVVGDSPGEARRSFAPPTDLSLRLYTPLIASVLPRLPVRTSSVHLSDFHLPKKCQRLFPLIKGEIRPRKHHTPRRGPVAAPARAKAGTGQF